MTTGCSLRLSRVRASQGPQPGSMMEGHPSHAHRRALGASWGGQWPGPLPGNGGGDTGRLNLCASAWGREKASSPLPPSPRAPGSPPGDLPQAQASRSDPWGRPGPSTPTAREPGRLRGECGQGKGHGGGGCLLRGGRRQPRATPSAPLGSSTSQMEQRRGWPGRWTPVGAFPDLGRALLHLGCSEPRADLLPGPPAPAL